MGARISDMPLPRSRVRTLRALCSLTPPLRSSRVFCAWGQLVGRDSTSRGLSLLIAEASKTGRTAKAGIQAFPARTQFFFFAWGQPVGRWLANWGAFASWRGSVKNWMDSRVEHPGLVGSCAYCSRLDNWLVTGRPTGGFRFSARKRQKLDGPGVPHPGLGGESVLGKRCRTSTTGIGDLNCTLLSSWRSSFRFKSRRCGWRSHVSEKLRHTELCGRPSNGIAVEPGVLWEVR